MLGLCRCGGYFSPSGTARMKAVMMTIIDYEHDLISREMKSYV